MAKPLVIVESPAKARTIAGFLGGDYTVRAGYLDRTSGSVLDDALATAQRLSSLRRGAVSISKDHARATLAQQIRDTLYADMAGLSGPAT